MGMLKNAWISKKKEEEMILKYKHLELQIYKIKRKSSQDLVGLNKTNDLNGVSLSGSPCLNGDRVRNGHSVGSGVTTDGAESEPISESTEWIHILASEKD